MGVKLKEKPGKTGIQLYLDINHLGQRHKEYLTNFKLSTGTTVRDRQQNKEVKRLAEQVRMQREREIQSGEYGLKTGSKANASVLGYFEGYISRYTKKDHRNMKGACQRLADFLAGRGLQQLQLKALTPAHIEDFADYLKSQSIGEGAASYFARFKKVLRYAVKEGTLAASPATEITIKRETAITKATLTPAEIQLLASTPCSSPDVKQAFLFCCFCGLRWSDVKTLTWQNINLAEMVLQFAQAKTGKQTRLPLHPAAVQLLPPMPSPAKGLVWALPTANGANKTIKALAERAGLPNKVTWHCARHSLATNLVAGGQDISIVSRLMGHSTLAVTSRYVRIAEEQQRAALNVLPPLA